MYFSLLVVFVFSARSSKHLFPLLTRVKECFKCLCKKKTTFQSFILPGVALDTCSLAVIIVGTEEYTGKWI